MAFPSPRIADSGTGSSEPRAKRERTSLLCRAAPVALLGLLSAAASAGPTGRSCDTWHAEVLAAEGHVELLSGNDWKPLRAGNRVCRGDSIRVRAYSRAAIRLPDKTVLRLDQSTILTFPQPKDDGASWVDVLKGIIHVISRDPRSLRFNTPYANAGLEGTEFVLEVNDHETDVTVVEGQVKLSNQAGEVGVPSGQRGSAAMAQQPATAPIPDPIAALRWTPYFVPILGTSLPAADRQPRGSEAGSAEFFSRRAARRLSVGQVGDASSDLARALGLDPRNGDALALEALIALSKADNPRALALAAQAVEVSPSAPAPRLALSYAAEANSDLPGAVESAAQAADIAPDDALAWARLGEVRLASGNYDGAETAVGKALALRPDSAYAYTVRGFASLAGTGAATADAAFRKAVSLDPGAPLPRLGLALALIRGGDLKLGRQQLEIAVMLDPTNALSRSYMAKTYDAELRDRLSAAQLEIAKRLNGADPTPWLYDALLEQNRNRPIDALHNLQAAIDRNDNVGVYRSRLLVDEDLAARSSGIGQIHRTLGFEQLALLEGWKSLAANADDYSSHRLLSDVYSHLPRHEIARVDELFQSQLLQPLNVTPIRPQLGEANLFNLDTLGPSALAFNEFHPLIEENGLSYQGSLVGASNDTRGVDVAVAGLGDKVSYSVGWFDYATDGFRENDDFGQRIANALVQLRPGHDTSILTELRSSRIDEGDLTLDFDPTVFNPLQRQRESVDTARLGVRHALSERSTLVGALIAERADIDLTTGPYFASTTERRGEVLELQHSYRSERWRLTSGGSLARFRDSDASGTSAPLPGTQSPAFRSSRELASSRAYLYATTPVGRALTATVGGSLARVVGRNRTRTEVNPKLGLMWQAAPKTSVRAVAFRTLQEPLISKNSTLPSMEPTEVAGFNQRYFGVDGEEARRYGAAIDHRFSADVYAGAEVSRRKLDVPYLVYRNPSTPAIVAYAVDETSARSYAYWTPTASLALSTGYEYERFDNHGVVLQNSASDEQTRSIPITARYFHRSGLSAGATATWVEQTGDFARRGIGPDVPTTHGESRFWTLDVSLGYRLRNRRGLVSLNVNNMLDKHFRFQDVDPANPRILPQRTLLLRVSLAY